MGMKLVETVAVLAAAAVGFALGTLANHVYIRLGYGNLIFCGEDALFSFSADGQCRLVERPAGAESCVTPHTVCFYTNGVRLELMRDDNYLMASYNSSDLEDYNGDLIFDFRYDSPDENYIFMNGAWLRATHVEPWKSARIASSGELAVWSGEKWVTEARP